MFRTTIAAGLAALALAQAPTQAPAQDAGFYDGKTIRIIINLSAGGSTGVMAQLFANHWKEKIPGNPDFVVQPVTGGAQMKGIIEAQNARPDGQTLAWVSWSGATRAIGPASQRVDWSEFDVIGGMGVPTMVYMRNDVGGGVTGPDDLVDLDGIRIGGYRPGSYLDLTARMSLDLLGVDYGYTTGFGDGSSIVAALQRGEVNLHATPAANYFGGIKDNVVDAGSGLPLWHYELEGPDGEPVTDDQFEGIPSFREVATNITGAPPSSELWEAIQWLNEGMAGTSWFIGAPAGVDPEILDMLRETFLATASDPDFMAEVAETTGIVPIVTDAAAMEAMIEDLENTDPAIAELVNEYIASGTQ